MPVTYRGRPIATLDDVDVRGKRVLVRFDLNSPVDPSTRRILDASRIEEAARTLRELVERGAGVAILSHQGRPLEDDFISLEPHAELLSKASGVYVEFVMDVVGAESARRLSRLSPGEVVLLDNSRIVSEDYIEAPPEAHARGLMVSRLSRFFDLYVNDAFSASHRSQASIVGFPLVIPGVAGRVLEGELRALSRALEGGERPRVFVVGGAKLSDAVDLVDYLTSSGAADEVLTTGLVALLFLKAMGRRLPQATERLVERKAKGKVRRAVELIAEGRPVKVPLDFIVEEDGKVYISDASSLRGAPKDIGPSTIEYYRAKIAKARVVVIRGPAGVIEDPRFRRGTVELVRAALASNAHVILGGGHFRAVLSELGGEFKGGRVHVSTGGGALLQFLSGRPLPGLEALAESASRFKLVGGGL
ncbi:MAG: phosphoglycerate kinase [Desulfurococcales archaeon]|nr:phosphoglycerate kinase [Desulfurococcales archaeon]